MAIINSHHEIVLSILRMKFPKHIFTVDTCGEIDTFTLIIDNKYTLKFLEPLFSSILFTIVKFTKNYLKTW